MMKAVESESMKGFQMTDIGLLPNAWQVKQLKDVADTYSGSTPNRESKEYWEDGSIQWLKSGELRDVFVYGAEEFITELAVQKTAVKYVDKDTIAVAMYGATAGKVGYIQCRTTINQAICAIKSKGYDLWALFCFFWFINYRPQLLMKRFGGAQPNINQQIIKNLYIPLPPLPEQKKIAAVLSAIQEAKEKTENVISALKEMKKSMMKHLFTYGAVPIEDVGRVKRKETEIGMMPKTWELGILNDLCERIVDCPHSTPIFVETGVLCVRNFNIRDGKLVLDRRYFTSDDQYVERTKRCEPIEGDILFSREAPVGEACLVPSNMKLSMGQRMMLLRTKSELLDNRFLVQALYSESVQHVMHSSASGVTAKHLNVADVRRMSVPLPSLSEQKQIADSILAIDNKIEVEENKLSALNSLFSTLLSLLMTGKLRVNHLEI